MLEHHMTRYYSILEIQYKDKNSDWRETAICCRSKAEETKWKRRFANRERFKFNSIRFKENPYEVDSP